MSILEEIPTYTTKILALQARVAELEAVIARKQCAIDYVAELLETTEPEVDLAAIAGVLVSEASDAFTVSLIVMSTPEPVKA
jgi:hypothetical protein